MSVVDYIEEISKNPREGAERGQADEASRVFKDLEEVEATLRAIGVTLEPRFFDVSLAARIGATSRR
jgi:hypothetical protein